MESRGKEGRRADLSEANLALADLRGAYLRGADLSWANLSEADLFEANLTRAILSGANLTQAKLYRADLFEVYFEPKLGTLPDLVSVAFAKNLSSVQFLVFPHALVELREAFKKAGFRRQEREITYAIKHNERLDLWGNEDVPIFRKAEDGHIFGKAESAFDLIFFELPSDYGMSPGRPLLILIGLVFVFSIPYAIVLWRNRKEHGIWKGWLPERVRTDIGSQKPELLILRGYRVPLFAVYFSLLSAFSIGWRELNVGNWISRVQSEEYVLRPTGWVRTVSGIQSLISVYLLALWALTYFGRPFE